ncbi:hypothetical protein Xind_00112 [Xenorhabdus indica]|nr:hypothetical protein [Xenorhabdus indica]
MELLLVILGNSFTRIKVMEQVTSYQNTKNCQQRLIIILFMFGWP